MVLSHNSTSRMMATILICFWCTLLLVQPLALLYADPSATNLTSPSIPDNEETRKLLEQSLSSVEIEREIIKITADQALLERKLELLRDQVAEKQSAIVDKQERAGAVLRSYYMGERDGLLLSFLSARSISKVLNLFNYYEIIIGHDRDILSQYEDQYKELKASLQATQRSSEELGELKKVLEEQKIRVAEINKDIENGVRDSSDPERMNALLQEFALYWENIGLHEVKTYFKALSSAMNKLPQFVQNREGVLTRKGMTYTLNLKEEDLNQFLQSQNKLFKDFAFHFNDGFITASGKSGGLTLTLTGHYTIQDEPMNGLMFEVDKVVFNGLELPDSTRQSLEEEFDLGFYPGKIVSFLKASAVDSKDGILHVKLSISF